MAWAGLSPVPLGVWAAEAGLRFQLCTHIPTCGGLPVPSALRDTGWVVRHGMEAARQGRLRSALRARPWAAQVRLGPQGWAGVGHRRVTQEALPSAVRHLGPGCFPRCARLKLSPTSSTFFSLSQRAQDGSLTAFGESDPDFLCLAPTSQVLPRVSPPPPSSRGPESPIRGAARSSRPLRSLPVARPPPRPQSLGAGLRRKRKDHRTTLPGRCEERGG